MEVATQKRKKKRTRERSSKGLDLALDINLLERRTARALEKGASFPGQKRDVVCSIFQQMSALVIDDELGCISIRLETEFLSDETKFHIRLVSV
jgi:hypothetical protein